MGHFSGSLGELPPPSSSTPIVCSVLPTVTCKVLLTSLSTWFILPNDIHLRKEGRALVPSPSLTMPDTEPSDNPNSSVTSAYSGPDTIKGILDTLVWQQSKTAGDDPGLTLTSYNTMPAFPLRHVPTLTPLTLFDAAEGLHRHQ